MVDYEKDYDIIKELGEGSFGKAQLAVNKTTGSKVVVKIVDFSLLDKVQKRQVLKEGQIMLDLDHKNIIKFERFAFDKEKAILIIELAENGDLGKRIEQQSLYGKFDEYVIITWVIEISEALKYCHAQKIIHRDIKPDNIFLSKDNEVKLGDFGISKMLGDDEETTKTRIGDFSYLSPEIFLGKEHSFSTDIWSLGIVLYELCLLKHPFDKYHIRMNMKKDPVIVIPDLTDETYSERLRNLLKKMLSINPDERPSLDEIIKECKLIQDASRYSGKIVDGKKKGKGRYYYENGDKYDGEWDNNKFEGKGIYFYHSGAKYDGEWHNGNKNGKGTQYYVNGDKFEGEWKDDKRDGQGKYTYKDGKAKEGIWKEDVYQK
jgi:NIMA (never in mitosis gene a)-related kinase